MDRETILMPFNINFGPPVEPTSHRCDQRGPSKTGYCNSCAPSPYDQNVAPPPAPPEPEHVICVKAGQERRILKELATPDVMAAITWDPWHPVDYRDQPKRKPN